MKFEKVFKEKVITSCMLIKKLRKEKGISQKNLADIAGIDATAISKIETRGVCSTATMFALISALNYTLPQFFEEQEKFDDQIIDVVKHISTRGNMGPHYVSDNLMELANAVIALDAVERKYA
jgi:transcriptional regulator with XRE-family HTH domain